MEQASLYQILAHRVEAQTHSFEVALNRAHRVFEGHFPGNPILPGACTLRIIKACAAVIVGREVRYATIDQCKFTAVVVPDDTPIRVHIQLSEQILRATVEFRGTVVVKLKSTITTR